MITDSQKAQVLAQIKRNVPYTTIAEEFKIPELLIKEWAKLSGHDLVVLEANVHAVETVLTKGEVVDDDNLKLLKGKLEQAALELVKELPHSHGDVVYAKSIQLCSDTISRLYLTFFKSDKPTEPTNPFNQVGISAFSSLMKD